MKSAKEIADLCGVDLWTAGVVHDLLTGKIEPFGIQGVADYERQCATIPDDHGRLMAALNTMLETCGVAPLHESGRPSQVVGEFLNTGDQYCGTVCYRYDTKEYLIMCSEDFQLLMFPEDK